MKSNNKLAVSAESKNSGDFDRCIDFLADMIEKYGNKVLDEIEAEEFCAVSS